MTTLYASAAAEALDRLHDVLDLSNVRLKLANPDEGVGCSEAELDLMEGEYRRFLALRIAHPDAEIVPCRLVDEMWHRHILDTRAYAADCDRIFGGFLHHFPYFGLRGEADALALDGAYDDTLELYRAAFGEPADGSTWTSPDASSHCRRACAPMKCK
jgi:hypothetical protein